MGTVVLLAEKVLNIELTKESIDKAIEYLKTYEKSIDAKTKVLVERLREIGVNVINSAMMSVPPVDRGTYDADSFQENENGHIKATIFLSGDQVLFIEFSAGVTFGTRSFNGAPNNPNYGNGMGVGTYPGQTHAEDPEGWWYKDRYGASQHTYGIRAHQPMFNADMEMRKQLVSIAREVFK